MRFRWPTLSRFATGCLLVLPLGYGVFVAWQEVCFRQHFNGLPVVDSPTAAAPAREAPDFTAVLSVLGLQPNTALQTSTQSLTLQACFVTAIGVSKALLADAQGPRLYRVGEGLPGGSVLRRVEADHVVLWSKGREERLLLKPPATRLLNKLESRAIPSAPVLSTHYLRPVSGQSE